MRKQEQRKKNKPKGKKLENLTKEKIQTLAMNSWMQVYARGGPLASSKSSMSCTMSTFFMRASVVGDSEEVALVSKRAAFLLRGKERKKMPL